jgi:FkbM family methyltransferase
MTPKLTIRSFTNDQFILDKVFYSNFYRVKGFKDTERKPTILDIGAHCGYFTFAAAALGAKRVYALEPFIENYKVLLQNISDDRVSAVVPFQMGVYLADVVLTFGYPQPINNSFFDFARVGPTENMTSDRICKCWCVSLDTLLTHYIDESIDILKISMSYGEVETLVASEKVATQVTHICGEAALDEKSKLLFQNSMATKGFKQFLFEPVEGETNKMLFLMSKDKLENAFEMRGK